MSVSNFIDLILKAFLNFLWRTNKISALGQRKGFSQLDAEKLNKLYECQNLAVTLVPDPYCKVYTENIFYFVWYLLVYELFLTFYSLEIGFELIPTEMNLFKNRLTKKEVFKIHVLFGNYPKIFIFIVITNQTYSSTGTSLTDSWSLPQMEDVIV